MNYREHSTDPNVWHGGQRSAGQRRKSSSYDARARKRERPDDKWLIEDSGPDWHGDRIRMRQMLEAVASARNAQAASATHASLVDSLLAEAEACLRDGDYDRRVLQLVGKSMDELKEPGGSRERCD